MDVATHIRRELNKLSQHLCSSISSKPVVYIILPVIITFCLSFGFLFVTLDSDVVDVFTPLYSKAEYEQQQTEEFFPTNYSNYYVNRRTKVSEKGCNVRITSLTGTNVIKNDILTEVLELDNIIRNYSFGKVVFTDVCAKRNGSCLLNPIVDVYYANTGFVSHTNLTYPSTIRSDGEAYFLGSSLGGVTTHSGEESYIKSAREITLRYILKPDAVDKMSSEWEKLITVVLSNYDSEFINIVYYTSQTISDQFYSTFEDNIPFIAISFATLVVLSSILCMMADCVLSKPMLALCGFFSASLACVSGFGLVCFFQIDLNVAVIVAIFFTIGIGLDNTFVLISSWRETDPMMSTENRLILCFNDTIISIAITNFANAIIYLIVAINPFMCIRVPCLCVGSSLFFLYVYQITFFGACVFFTGRREMENRHCCACVKVVSKDESPNLIYRYICAGGVVRDEETTLYEVKPIISWLIQAYIGPFIMHRITKCIIILSIVVYEVFAIYGCTTLSKLIEEYETPTDSIFPLQLEDRVAKYGPPVSVLMTDGQEYWREDVQNNIEIMAQSFESNQYICGQEFTVSWFKSYCQFLLNSGVSCKNITEDIFIDKLQNQFLETKEGEQFKLDLVFSQSGDSKTIDSRVLIMATCDAYTYSDRVELLKDMRTIANSANSEVIIFSLISIFTEQLDDVISQTLELFLVAAVCMFVLTLLFVPNPVSSIWITFNVISIQIGVIGYLILCDVELDIFTMIFIILNVGFSVEFSTHMAYAYVTSDAETSNQRLLSALSTIGMPVIQLAMVITVSAVFLLLSSSVVLINAFKAISLMMLIGVFHAIFVLPVVLTILGPGTRKDLKRGLQNLLNKSTTLQEVTPLVASPTEEHTENHLTTEDDATPLLNTH